MCHKTFHIEFYIVNTHRSVWHNVPLFTPRGLIIVFVIFPFFHFSDLGTLNTCRFINLLYWLSS